jgi:hypothetical protein
MNLEEERDALRRELIGTQEMLAFVLQTVDEPVTVSKQQLNDGLPENAQIKIDDTDEGFVFTLVVVE